MSTSMHDDVSSHARERHELRRQPSFVHRLVARLAVLRGRPWLRALPFVVVVAVSFVLAARAPNGRRPFRFSLDVSPHVLAYVAIKPLHQAASAVVFLLAIFALGGRRVALSMAITLVVGLGWELAQTTVSGRVARAADVLPNMMGASAIALAFVATRARLERYVT